MFCFKASRGSACVVVGMFYNSGLLRDGTLGLSSAVIHFRCPCRRDCNGNVFIGFYVIESKRICRRQIRTEGHLPSGALIVG